MKTKAQATIEFSIAFVCAIVFLILTCNVFVWLNHCLVERQVEYGNTREEASRSPEAAVGGNPGVYDYEPPPLDVFSPGGYK